MDDIQNKEDVEVGTLIEQLQNTSALGKQAAAEPDPLKKEQVETFVIEKAGELVKESLDFMKSMKDFVSSAPNGEDMSALANLITATSSAIETLNKLIIIDKKVDTAVKLKNMDIQSRKEIADADSLPKALITREELFKKLLSNTQTITAEVIDIPTPPKP